MVDFGKPDELRRWLGEQPRQVGIALAARSALRVLPIIGKPSAVGGTGALLHADSVIVQTQFRRLSIAWLAFSGYVATEGSAAWHEQDWLPPSGCQ
jgi:hypothetical protein